MEMFKEFFGMGVFHGNGYEYAREPEGAWSWQHLLFVSLLMVAMVALVVERVKVCLKLTEQVILDQLVLVVVQVAVVVQEHTNKTNQSAVNRAISPHFIVNNNKKTS